VGLTRDRQQRRHLQLLNDVDAGRGSFVHDSGILELVRHSKLARQASTITVFSLLGLAFFAESLGFATQSSVAIVG